MSTEQVANRFYELAQQNQWEQIYDELFSANAKSIEPETSNGLPSVQGMDKIREKGKVWNSMIEEVHGGYCHAPQAVGNYFTCVMGLDATMKTQGRIKMDEIALYEVNNGKIVREQFFY